MKSRVLIACYSLSGRTRRVSGELGAVLGASEVDVEWIQDACPRQGGTGRLRCVVDALFGRSPSIKPPQLALRDYGLLVVATPIWMGRLAAPMRTYARSFGSQAAHVAFLCTAQADSGARAFEELEQLCGRRPLATLRVAGDEWCARTYGDRLAAFAGCLRTAREVSMHAARTDGARPRSEPPRVAHATGGANDPIVAGTRSPPA
jgi:flavodoxin